MTYMKKKIPFLIILAAGILSLSCKKEEETVTVPSISGVSMSDAVPFVRPGSSQSFTADLSNIYTSDKTDPGTLGVYWQIGSEAKDTTTRDASKSNPEKTVTITETGTYTVTCGVFAVKGGYYAGTSSATFQVIDPDSALTGLSDNTEVTINGTVWQARNLYGTESGRDYRDCEVVSALFGRYYTWTEAQTACPEGWHLPTAAEFDASLGDKACPLMAEASFMNVRMWNYWPNMQISNQLQFNAIPTGYIDLSTVQGVYGYKEYAAWWTADEIADPYQKEGLGIFRYIYESKETIQKGQGSKESLALNVRCIKD